MRVSEFLKIRNFEKKEVDLFLFHERNNIDFEYQYTSGSSRFINKSVDYKFYANKIDFSVFHIFNKIKKHCEKLEKNEGRDRQQCEYVGVNVDLMQKYFDKFNKNTIQKGGFIENEVFFAVDISMAYPTAAKKLGWINDLDFEKLKKTDKISRLACFGMLATQKFFCKYISEKKEIFIDRKKSNTDIFFYRLVYEIDVLLKEIIENLEDSVFFWVDCIFFKKVENISKVRIFFSKKGFKTTCWKCFDFCIIHNTDDVYSFCYKKFSAKKGWEKKIYIFRSYFSYENRSKKIERLKKIVNFIDS